MKTTNSPHRRTRLGVFFGALVSAILVSPPLFAQVDSYEIGVNGMACPFCAYGIEKKLSNLEGTDSLDIHIKKGTIDLNVADDKQVTPDQIQKAVKNAGFDIRSLIVRGTAKIRTDNRGTVEFSPGFSFPLRKYDGKQGKFEVTGKLEHQGSDWVLELTDREAP